MAAEAERPLRIGTRGSTLALRQANLALEALLAAHPRSRFEIKTVSTTGDKKRMASLLEIGGRGVFVTELEDSLRRRDIDIAVHSLKDLPSAASPGVRVAAVLARADPHDVLVSKAGSTLEELPAGATIGTGSPRRAAQLRAVRADLSIVPIRGNVDTRVGKVLAGEVDAAVLAAAGLQRLGMPEEIAKPLSLEVMLPAPGQGIIALQIREDDASSEAIVAPVDDPPSRAAADAERAFIRRLGAGCHTAVAALAVREDDALHIRGLVADPLGQTLLRDELRGPVSQAEFLGRELAERLLAAGASVLLAASE